MSDLAHAGETKKWDVLGISLSVLCGIHCLSAPLLLGLLPLFGLGYSELEHHHHHHHHGIADWLSFETVMMTLIFAVAAFTFFMGYRRHGRKRIFVYLALGILMFLGVRPSVSEFWHHAATVLGGVFFVIGHWKNWHYGRSKICAVDPKAPCRA